MAGEVIDPASGASRVVGEAALLVLDPLVATFGPETNYYRDQDVRRALAPVAASAERHSVAVTCIRHWTKDGNQKI